MNPGVYSSMAGGGRGGASMVEVESAAGGARLSSSRQAPRVVDSVTHMRRASPPQTIMNELCLCSQVVNCCVLRSMQYVDGLVCS